MRRHFKDESAWPRADGYWLPKDSTPTSSSASTTETATTIMSRTEPTYVTENAYNRDGQESAIRGEFGRRAASK